MKLRIFILAFFILALSLLPCSDYAPFSHTDEQPTIAYNNTDHHDDSHAQQSDLCSPFCTCNCCGRTIATFLAFDVFVPNVPTGIQKANDIFYKAPDYYNALDAIWQPPKSKV